MRNGCKMQGKKLDEIARAREEGKRIYQKILYALESAALAAAVCVLFMTFLK